MSQPAARKISNAPEHSTAYYFIEGLNELGIEHLFCNFGTDHAPTIEAMAERQKNGEKVPNVMLCPHENTAAHMAMGYAAVTGRGQAVLVHVDVGTANTANAMHNLFRSRLPVLLMSGKAPYTSSNELVGSRDTYVHFVQEPIDQGALVRPYMKWEWTLPSGVVVKEALRRAHTIMETKPAGPVYFMAQRETLTEKWANDQIRSYPAERILAAAGRRRRSRDDRAACRQDHRRRASDPDLRLCRPIEERAEADRGARDVRRHRGVRRQLHLQHLARVPLLPRLLAEQASAEGRRRAPGGRRRALVPGRRVAQREVVLGAYRRRHAQVRVADVDVPGQPAHAGRLRRHPRPVAGGAEGEGDAEVQGSGGQARRSAHRRAQGLARKRRQDGRQQGQA